MSGDLSRRQARQEAVRVSRMSPSELRGLFDKEQARKLIRQPLGAAVLWEYAGRQKPQLYGRLSVLVGQTLEQTLGGRTYNGVPKLVRLERNGQTREATRQDRASWDGLRSCWGDTLFAAMLQIMQSAQSIQGPELVALESLSLIRLRAVGSLRQFHTQLRTDTENAAAQSLRFALGISKYRRRVTKTTRLSAKDITDIAASTQPVFSLAGLSAEQVGAFAVDYLGRREQDGGRYGTYGIHPGDVAGDIYTTVPKTGRITLDAPIEDFPIGDHDLFVAGVPMETPGPSIGCPMMFDSELAGLFFRATVMSAGEAKLI